MNPSEPTPMLKLGRAVRKFFLSAFVIFTFLIYAVHERLAGPATVTANGLPAAPKATTSAPAPSTAIASPTSPLLSQNIGPTAAPTDNGAGAAATGSAVAPTAT